MSAPDGGLTSSSSSHLTKRNLEADARHVVDVADASRVLECSQVDRQLRFQHLVRHYLSQILHGCKSAYCTTPTCLSCQKRNALRPARSPTQLTARALAHYLASQDNPHHGLCPHELRVPSNSLEIDGANGTRLQQGQNGEWQYNVYPSASTVVHVHGSSDGREGARDHVKPTLQYSTSHIQQRVVDAVKQRHQTRKDTKSLSQNLFDSVTMIYAYSKQLPSSASLLHTLRSSIPLLPNATAPPDAVDAELQTKAGNSSQDATTTALANGETATPHVNRTTCLDHQDAQLYLRAHSHTHPSPTPPKLLSNGQQVHTIPYHLRDLSNPVKNLKAISQASLDGTLDYPRLAVTHTRKKDFTPNGNLLDMGRVRSPPTVSLKSTKSESNSIVGADPLVPVLSTLNCTTLEQLKDDVYNHCKDQPLDTFNFIVDYDTNRRYRPSTPFVNRSLFYTFSDPETLLKSFCDNNNTAFAKSPMPHLDSIRLAHSFRDWNRHNGALIFDSLWISLKALFTPPPELHVQKSPRPTLSRKGVSKDSSAERPSNGEDNASATHRYLSNLEAAHIVMVCIHALTSLVSVGWPHTWAQLRKLRAWGIVIPNAASDIDEFKDPYLNMIDELEYEPAFRLSEQLLCAIGTRTCHEQILAVMKKQKGHSDDDVRPDSLVNIIVQHLKVLEHVALSSKRRMTSTSSTNDDPGWTVTATLMEWLKTIITRGWKSRVEVNKWSSVGSAIMLLNKLYVSSNQLNLREQMFEIPFFNERLDTVEGPVKFLNWEEQPNTFHILQFPALFPAEYLVRYFRTINFTTMMAQYDHTTRMHQMQALLEKFLREPHNWLIKSRMKVSMSDYLILNVSRENPLRDTLDQLWGLEKRMLLKPLKVKMGQHEGEVGADHGGVTYEFFRVVLSQAFKPDYGMFTLDSKTRMTWFQPNSLEPDWKFEMIGMLFSLAVYNGVTLPITFPLALYRFLLPMEAPLRDRGMGEDDVCSIKDGWPDLTKGLEQLLAWTDGDVGDVFMRDYVFSYEAFGQRIDHNMEESYIRPQKVRSNSLAVRPEELQTARTKEAKQVTNENRGDFVRDYIHHLTFESVSPQLRAFRKGFLACLQPKSLHFFTPSTLRNLIEGEQHISISELRQCARYEEGYSTTHPTIQNFWHVVEQYTQEDCRHLLEFVTASDRVPVTGYDGITFHIVRIGDVEMLPTSSTCFGKLYLPDYKDEESLRTKVELAIRNSKGFGVV